MLTGNFTDGFPTNTSTVAPLTQHLDSSYTRLDIVLLVSYVVVFVVGISGNTLVCMMFKLSNGKLKVMEYMICCLALTDLVASIINPSLYTYWQVTKNRVWHFGYVGCKFLPVVNRSITNVSFGLIMLINIDRCVVITQPFRPKMNKKHVKWVFLFIVVVAVLLEIPFIYHVEVIPTFSCRVPNSTNVNFAYPAITVIIIRMTLFFFAFLSTVICIYKELYNKEDLKSLKEQKRTDQNKTVLIMLATIAIVFILLVFPRDILHVIYIISWLDHDGIPFTHLLKNINAVCKILHMCNSICNVFIYAGLHRRFRRDVKRKVSSAILARTNGMRAGNFKVVDTPDGPLVVSAPASEFNSWDDTSSSTL